MAAVRIIIPVIILGILCSCAWTTGNLKILDPTIIRAIHPGSTTMAAVEDSLGPPDNRVKSAAAEETWEYYQTDYFMIAGYWEMRANILKIQFSQGKVTNIHQGYTGHEGISFWPSAGER
jgi:hypothetical protein